jgi:hypothetical protein
MVTRIIVPEVAPPSGEPVPEVPALHGLHQARYENFIERYFCLVCNPERPLKPWDVIQLCDQLSAARI